VLDLPRLLEAPSDRTAGCLLRLAAPFQFCALFLPAAVQLGHDDRVSSRSAEQTLIRVGTLMSRVGLGAGGSS